MINEEGTDYLLQTATYRPHGLLGRLYWAAVWPFHGFIFPGMAKRIICFEEKRQQLERKRTTKRSGERLKRERENGEWTPEGSTGRMRCTRYRKVARNPTLSSTFCDKGQRTKDKGQRTKDKGQRTKDKGQRTEDKDKGQRRMAAPTKDKG